MASRPDASWRLAPVVAGLRSRSTSRRVGRQQYRLTDRQTRPQVAMPNCQTISFGFAAADALSVNHLRDTPAVEPLVINPPFGRRVQFADSPWLTDYELARRGPLFGGPHRPLRRSQRSEVLFVEYAWRSVPAGGG